MHKKISAMFGLGAVAAILCCGGMLSAAQTEKIPPKDLIQYIREASRLGLKDEQIEQNAVTAGWPAATVKEAVSYVRSSSATAPATDANPSQATPPGQQPDATQPPSSAAEPAPTDAPKSHGVPDEYRIGAGDVLQVSVWKEPEASVGSTVVRPDGKIGLPLLKEIEVVGMTPAEAEKAITARLAKFIPAADVTVVVSAINSKKVYMVGAVKKEGPISYSYRMTVMQAISEAGGLNDYAKRKKIYILRTQNGKDYRLPFDYEAVLRGERMELNIPLLPGDTLVVPH